MSERSQQRFQKVELSSASKSVSDNIEWMILSGELESGDQLPAERDLAEEFGVSRPIIRQALVILEERGLVEVSWGRGTYVTKATSEVLKRSFQLFSKRVLASEHEIFELRRYLEIPTCGLAARFRTDSGLTVLRQSIEEMKENFSGLIEAYRELQSDFVDHPAAKRHIESDISFHMALARMSGNRLIPAILEMYVDSLKESMARDLGAGQGQIKAIDNHVTILKAVESGDPKAAENAMSKHLHRPRTKAQGRKRGDGE